MNQELLDTINELVETKTKLNKLKVKSKLKTNTKIYKKLSDIEIIISKIECHTSEQIKLNKFIAKMLYCLVQLHPNAHFTDHDKVVEGYWKEFCRIAD